MTCPNIPEIDLGDLGAAIHAQMKGRRYPLSGMMELTDRCDLNCVHCYINQPAGSIQSRSKELSTDQIKDILRQAVEAGTLFMTFTGGEVFLRQDFQEIYTYARRLGLLVTIFTNATLITPRIADLLDEIRPQMVEITLYGATKETYERVTRIPGSYDRCLNGINLLREKGIKFSLKTMLLNSNKHELAQMQAMAEEFGVSLRYDGTLWPRMDRGLAPFKQQIPVEEMITMDFEDPERREEWIRLARDFSGFTGREKYVFSCNGGVQSYHIDSAGNMCFCTMVREPAYSLGEMSFMEAWRKIGELRKLERQLSTPCQTCTLGALCTQCPGWSQAIHGDNESPVEFNCAMAHERKKQVDQFLRYNVLIEENEEALSYE
ncbi:MAG: radical SAM protein [Brevefilum sp.]|nr:radical SAM protein [Brevefilum sp.]MDT8381831.1 radical SAM protein [Brevefilum sp.]